MPYKAILSIANNKRKEIQQYSYSCRVEALYQQQLLHRPHLSEMPIKMQEPILKS